MSYDLIETIIIVLSAFYRRNGPDWWKLRKAFQKHLSKVQCIRQYVLSTDTVVEQFMERRIKHKGYTRDFGPELSRLFLECEFSVQNWKNIFFFKLYEYYCS